MRSSAQRIVPVYLSALFKILFAFLVCLLHLRVDSQDVIHIFRDIFGEKIIFRQGIASVGGKLIHRKFQQWRQHFQNIGLTVFDEIVQITDPVAESGFDRSLRSIRDRLECGARGGISEIRFRKIEFPTVE